MNLDLLRKKYEYKQNLIGTEYQTFPLDQTKVRINVIGEILQAKDFDEADNLYIIYDFMLPPWFQLDFEEILEVHNDDDKRMEEMIEDWNKTASVTQASTSTIERGVDGDKRQVANFCFPFDLQMLANQDYIELNKTFPKSKEEKQEDHEINFPKFPILFMQINSMDSMGRTKIEGYGYCHIPREPGFHQVEVQTWAPRVSLGQQIHTFFLGGSMKVKDIRKIAETSFTTDENMQARLNRFNVQTESKGSVTVRFNVGLQSKTYGDQKKVERTDKQIELKKEEQKQKQQMLNLNYQSSVNTGKVNTSRFQYNKL